MTRDSSIADHPPRHVIVIGHPVPGSFNHAIADHYCRTVRDAGQEAVIRDLYALDFDPRLRGNRFPEHHTAMSMDVAQELGLLREADAIVFVYPIWFGMPPAMIKGYVDRVMGAGLTPAAISHGIQDSILAGKSLATFSTSAASSIWLDEHGQMEAVRKAFDRYLMAVFGMTDAGHEHFGSLAPDSEDGLARHYLTQVEERARVTCMGLTAKRGADQRRLLLATSD
ncbi:NAD(P)H-dependent oxidoreductase [Sphingomonas alpina]|uniref:NAD(P)H-dependent oxidoreductase n=1 Tax=Sphingomonas alpina TaxID=653931 RepID=A0A7H0LLP4_9SPHN|nr:NAD(P)H-dependent oxidoreductase [Sphingomonas alpina]QNQ10597.1 NAD(P)H-dependent oxidoreductase [Sphingomonas alpina]